MTATSPVTLGLVLALGCAGAAEARIVPTIDLYTQAQAPPPASQPPAPSQTPSTGPGRVVVTVVSDSLRIPNVQVVLRNVDANIAVGKTTTDVVGQATFPDVGPGRYTVLATRDGFADSSSTTFSMDPDEKTRQVLIEMRLTFVRESVDVVVPANSPTESLQPVAVSDLLTGAKMDIQPLAGDDFQSLLTLLPSVIRGWAGVGTVVPVGMQHGWTGQARP